jgi:ADP-ribosyl-[dinitrogen reductase] hydrolase
MVEPTLSLDRFKGCLVGLALGDALGAPYEFSQVPTIDVKRFHKGYFGTAPGDGTDDSALALKLGLSLVAKGGLDGDDYLSRLVEWANSNPPDIGSQTAKAARAYEHGVRLPDDEEACGNGSLMACAPLGLFYAGQGRHAAEAGEHFSHLTHPSSRSMGAVGLFVQSISRLVVDPRENPPCEAQVRVPECFDPTDGAIGFVTWCAALAYQASDRCEAADAFPQLVWVLEKGGDTDTNGAVAGALLGARFGMAAWPQSLLAKLVMRETFEDLATLLYEYARAQMA